MAITHALDRSLRSHDVKTATASDCDFADMNTFFFAVRHNSFDEITGAKPFDRSSCFGRGARKAILVHPAHLPGIMSDSLHPQRLDLRRLELLRRAVTDARRIDPMRFRQASLRAIEFRQTA